MVKKKTSNQNNGQVKKIDPLTDLILTLQDLADYIDDQKHRTIVEFRLRKTTKAQLLKELTIFVKSVEQAITLARKILTHPSLIERGREVFKVLTSIITIIKDAHSDIALNNSDNYKDSLYTRFLRTFKSANEYHKELTDLASWLLVEKELKPENLTDTEENILKALGKQTLIGKELLVKAGYDHSSSHYRGILSSLIKRGILGHNEDGYFNIYQVCQ